MTTTTVTRRVVFLLATLGSTPVEACLWDFDTLMMERQRFPNALELITGKFLRHSPEFYHWRIEDRRKRLETEPNNLALYDDLAVAYDKTGKHDKAIETMLSKEAKKPGLYETYANLGTFYIHAGQPETGLPYIKKAIKINPNAHFGREVFQLHLVEYVLSRRSDGRLSFPLQDDESGRGFAAFVDDYDTARKGVLGMMRFGHFDSPVLLEALADLLPGGRMKARAYLKASYEVKDGSAQDKYLQLARMSLVSSGQMKFPVSHTRLPLGDVEAALKKEIEEAESWYATIRADEIRWIRDGLNPDEEFAAKYYDEPSVSYGLYDRILTAVTFGGRLEGAMFVIVWIIMLLVAGKIGWNIRVKKRRRTLRPSENLSSDALSERPSNGPVE